MSANISSYVTRCAVASELEQSQLNPDVGDHLDEAIWIMALYCERETYRPRKKVKNIEY